MRVFRSLFFQRGRSFGTLKVQRYSTTSRIGDASSNNSTPDERLFWMTSDKEECRTVYDNWADNYEKDVKKWGYDMPTQFASLLGRHFAFKQDNPRILDAGAGDGLSGKALRETFPKAHLIGVDLSPLMLQGAKERGCYDDLHPLDLNQPPFVSFDSESLDAITCVGTMTYVDPNGGTLEDFCRIVRRNGYICYTNRTDKLENFQSKEQQLIDDGVWSLVEKVGPLPYLPGHPEFQDDIQVVIFLYQRT